MESEPSRNLESPARPPRWRPGLGLLGRAAEPTIAALSGCFLPLDAVGGADHHHVAARVAGKINLMPLFVAAPILVLTLLFGLSARLRFGRPARAVTGDRLLRWVEAWRAAPLGPLRDLVTVHERLASFVYFERRRAAAERAATSAGEAPA